ncbi:MAG: hypothetical protein Q8O86_00775, partial [Dehalococcoidia bacterium]|nr:hypothetical protein [Dehalococcoidia bacterium]
MPNEAEGTRFMDWFILEHVLGDGKTILDKFVRENGGLSPLDKDMLLRWKEVVEGLFEVEERKGDRLVLRDLVDDCRYVAKSNIGPWTLSEATPGCFMATRLVPLEDYWMLSGTSEVYPSSERGVLYELAYEYRMKNPSAVFKCNEAKLKQAWDLQAEYRADFIAFFGNDLVVLERASLAQKWSDYHRYRNFAKKGEKDGLTPAERARQLGATPSLPKIDFP